MKNHSHITEGKGKGFGRLSSVSAASSSFLPGARLSLFFSVPSPGYLPGERTDMKAKAFARGMTMVPDTGNYALAVLTIILAGLGMLGTI